MGRPWASAHSSRCSGRESRRSPDHAALRRRPRLRHCALATDGMRHVPSARRVATCSSMCSPTARAPAIRWRVVLDAEGLDEASMQAIARWTQLPETTFLLPPTTRRQPSYRVRIFTPRREVPFAGHPSVGSAHGGAGRAAWRRRATARWCRNARAGLLPLRVEGSGATRTIAVRAPRARVVGHRSRHDPRLARALAGLRWAPGRRRCGTRPPLVAGGTRRRSRACARGTRPGRDRRADARPATPSGCACLRDAPTHADHHLVGARLRPRRHIPRTRSPAAPTPASPRGSRRQDALPGTRRRLSRQPGPRSRPRRASSNSQVDADGEVVDRRPRCSASSTARVDWPRRAAGATP